ncbi:MAG TPA: hypothetical protein VLW52_04895 [Opitutaceae bacterium]|nr:hypothetical protein [Opitutaceae bacterium]
MNSRILLCVVFLVLVGCATTPAERIAKNRAVFESWPPDVQAKVQAGEVALGFTPEQVQIALGAPDHSFTRVTERGTEEVWGYRDRKPRISVGVGVVGGGGNTRVGGATVVNSGGPYYDDVLRVVFEGGRVSAIEKVTG